MRGVLASLAFAALAFCAGPAAGQPRGVPQAEHERIVAELTLDFQAAIARERRLADERESRRIGELQAELRRNEAALQAAVARRGVAQAEIETLRASLEQTRAEYAALVNTVTSRDVQTNARVLSFQAGIAQILARAPPQTAEALRRFSQGDRVGAWPEIERAALAGDAQMLRDAIGLRTIMVGFGEATAQDLRVLADRLAALDPGDFLAQQTRQSLLYSTQGPSSPAVFEATIAMTNAAQNELERHWAFGALGEIEMARGRLAEAERAFQQALDALRRASGAEAPPDSLLMAEQALLTYLGNLRVTQNDFAGADRYFEQMGAPLRAYAARQPNEALPRDMLITYLMNYSSVRSNWLDIAGAERLLSEADPLIARSLADEPHNKSRIWQAAQHYVQVCMWRSSRHGVIQPGAESPEQLSSLVSAGAACDRAVEILRAMPDPSSWDRDFLANAIIGAANVRLALGHEDAAEALFREAGAIIDVLLVEQPGNPMLLRRRVLAVQGIAVLSNSAADWDAVLETWDAAGRAAPLQYMEQEARNMAAVSRDLAAQAAGAARPVSDAELAARQEAAGSLRQVVERSPNNPELLRAYIGALTALAYTPGSGQSWREVVAAYQALERLTPLSGSERSAQQLAGRFYSIERSATEEPAGR